MSTNLFPNEEPSAMTNHDLLVGPSSSSESFLLREPLLASTVDSDPIGTTTTPTTTCTTTDHDNDSPPLLLLQQQDQQTKQQQNDDFVFYFRTFQVLYFLSGLSGAAWGRLGVIYYNALQHLTAVQIGYLQGTSPLVSFITQPLWGMWADSYWYSRKIVWSTTQCATILALLAIPVLVVPWHGGFAGMLGSVWAMAVFNSAGVMDAHVLEFLQESSGGLSDNNNNELSSAAASNLGVEAYGKIRVWTAVSWGLGCVGMGYITDHWGFNWNFGLFAAMMLSTLLVVFVALPARSQSEQARYDRSRRRRRDDNNNTDDNSSSHVTTASPPLPLSDDAVDEEHVVSATVSTTTTTTTTNTEHHPAPPLHWHTLYELLFQWPMLLWLTEVACVGAGMSLVESFLFVYLQNDLNASTVLCGYTVGVTVLLELPIFAYSAWLLQHVGHDGLFVAAMMAYAVRVWGYTMLTTRTVHWVLLLEVLHGITFACMWVASVDFGAKVAPEEWSTTVQSILSTFLTCVGGGVGPILGGMVMEQYGAVTLYRSAGVIVFAVMLLRVLLWICGYGHDDFVRRKHHERLLWTEAAVMTTTTTRDTDSPDEESNGLLNSEVKYLEIALPIPEVANN